MSSLYIGGAQCVYAQFLEYEDWEKYDAQESEMAKIAEQFNVFISRYALDQGDDSFVIMNKPARHECFYESAAFEVDMSLETSEDFHSRAQDFIKNLKESPEFSTFHKLNCSNPKVLDFVVS